MLETPPETQAPPRRNRTRTNWRFGVPRLGRPALPQKAPRELPVMDTETRYCFGLVQIGDIEQTSKALAQAASLKRRLENLEAPGPGDTKEWGEAAKGKAARNKDDEDSEEDDTFGLGHKGGKNLISDALDTYRSQPLDQRTRLPRPMLIPAAWAKTKEAEAYLAAYPDADIYLLIEFLKWYCRFLIAVDGEGAKDNLAVLTSALAMQRGGDDYSGMGNTGIERP